LNLAGLVFDVPPGSNSQRPASSADAHSLQLGSHSIAAGSPGRRM